MNNKNKFKIAGSNLTLKGGYGVLKKQQINEL